MITEKKRYFLRMLLVVLVLLHAGLILRDTSREVHAAAAGFVKVSGKTYYRLSSGKYKKGWLTLNGKKYYFNKSTGVMVTGWTGSGAKRRYFSKTDGHMFTGWVTVSGKKRFFSPSTGYMATGWVTASNGNRRYFDTSTGYMTTGWFTENNEKYYFRPATGVACKGWVSNKVGTRYFNTSTGAMYTGLKRISGYYYYFYKSNGYVYKKGWGTISGKKYYFDPTTGKAQTGWLTLNGKSYYFNTKGVMYADTKVKISGQYYTFDKDGVSKDVPYEISGNNVKVYSGGKSYLLVKEYLTHPGIADGKVSDEELLAALIECEAGMQGKIGMEACALAILNRTISPGREFPANLRYVIYQGVNYPQYSPVRNGSLLKRLNGYYEYKTTAQQAAKEAMAIFYNYVTKGTKRTLKGFATKDFNYKYFMAPSSFWSQNLNFSKVEYCTYTSNGESHVFFVDWISG